MSLYRVASPVSRSASGAREEKVWQAGDVLRHTDISAESIERLTAKGTIYQIDSPPLAAMEGWRARASKAEKAGIVTIVDLIEAELGVVARLFRVPQATVTEWQEQALDLLRAPKQRRG